VLAARVSVLVVFALNGLVLGSWAPRMPRVAEQIDAGPGELGLALLGASIGMIAAASLTGRLCARLGARALVFVSALGTAVVLPLVAIVGSPLQLGLVLVLLGATVGTQDVAMNVAAVTVVRRTERPIMPVFHAAFSFGALAGSMGAAFAAGHGVGLLGHFLPLSALALAALLAVIRFVPREEPVADAATHESGDRRMLRRPVLWLLGVIALCSAIVEGGSGDWSALFAVRERGLGEAAAAITFSVFCVAMALVRLFGEQAERRWGPDRMLIGGSVVAGTGLLATALIPSAPLAYVGFGLAGGGLAFAFPVALNMAGAVGRRADGTGGEREIGFVTTIAYSGFLIGPPMLGGIAQLTSLEVATAAARRRDEKGSPERVPALNRR
jgi:MFS family permease